MPELPKISITKRSIPNSHYSMHEYEDSLDHKILPLSGRFAIADGATESAFPKPWAKLLTHSFVRQPGLALRGQWDEWLTPLQNQWHNLMKTQERPWYERAKLEEGAYAAFLGLVIAQNNQWRAIAVGDCCLFQIRDERLHQAFPIKSADDFTNCPDLIGSSEPPKEILDRRRSKICKGDWELNDQFLLVTDALASYFLRLYEQGKDPAAIANSWVILSDQDFKDQVNGLRDAFAHDDDITLMHIELTELSISEESATHEHSSKSRTAYKNG